MADREIRYSPQSDGIQVGFPDIILLDLWPIKFLLVIIPKLKNSGILI